jgi:hypothetical protein
MISASNEAFPLCTVGSTGAFDGDPYGDDEAPVYRGFSLPCASFREETVTSGLNLPCFKDAGAPTTGHLNGFDFELSSTARICGTAFLSDTVSPCMIRSVALSPEALRSRMIDHIKQQGEAEVQLFEKHGVLKAKVHIFVDSTQELLGMAIRIRAGSDGATAEWRRYSGDALHFHRFFRQVKDAVECLAGSLSEGSECFDAALGFPVTSLEDAIATAQVVPEEAAASLARSIPHVDASEVAKLPRYVRVVQDWLSATDVRIVGPACSLAKRICEVDSTCAPTLLEIAVQQAEMALDETSSPEGQLALLRPRLLLRLAARLA